MKFMHIVQYLKLKGWSHDGRMLGENFILLQKLIMIDHNPEMLRDI
jgi:hypothetical protein